jgi:PAS domain S-box-containing protein
MNVKSIIESLPGAVAVLDDRMRYVSASPSWLAFFALEPAVEGASVFDGYPPAPAKFRTSIERALAGIPGATGDRVDAVVVTVEDVTELHRSAEQRQLFYSLAVNNRDYVSIRDASYRAVFVNDAGLQLAGLRDFDEARNQPILEFFFPEDVDFVADVFLDKLRRDGSCETEIRFRNFTTGAPVWVHYSAFCLNDADGAFAGMASIARDVSGERLSRERLEEARLKAEQATLDTERRRDEFLTTLAHELRNPIAAICNGLHAILMGAEDASLKAVPMMERQAAHLARLVDDLMEASRMTTGRIELSMERVDLAEALGRAVEDNAELLGAARRAPSVCVAPGIHVDGDPARLAQVFSILLNNAGKYTPVDGTIAVTAEHSDGCVVVRIRDDGIGIPDDMLEPIFDMFAQVNPSKGGVQAGIGVGLSLARRLLDLHCGTIVALSDGLGKGSEFVVRLPLSAQPAEPAPPPDPRPAAAPLRVMVVDDDHDVADSMAMVLECLGCVVEVAYGGAAALDKAPEFMPERMFVDIGMPGMDGHETVKRLRASPGGKDIIVAALTGWGQPEDMKRSADAGFDRHFVKPISVEDIEAFIADKVEGRI